MAKTKRGSSMMVYEWGLGSRVDGNAQLVGERVETIRTIHAGAVTPELLVDDARDERSPLHPCFEWDDVAAAQKYRLDQARLVLRSLTVTVIEDRRTPVRAFVCVERSEEEGRVYVSLQDALVDEALRQQLLDTALHEIQSWRQRYSRLRELVRVFEAVDQLEIDESVEH